LAFFAFFCEFIWIFKVSAKIRKMENI